MVDSANQGSGIQQNLLDRVVSYFSPELGAKRLQMRATIGALDSYAGASMVSRAMRGWATTRGSADADLINSLPKLRERSRDLVRNAPLAGGAINTTVTSVVGTGLTMQSQVDADFLGMSEEQADEWQRTTEREWRLWAESTDCDITRTQDFAGLQDLVMRSALESGDCFTLLPFVPLKGATYELRVQVVEADRVASKDYAPPTAELAMGIKRDKFGAPIEYHILRSHPGSYIGGTWEWDIVPAFGGRTGRRNVLHHYRKLRPGQSRGIPYLAPVIDTLKQLDRYTEAEITAAVVSGLFAVFIKSPSGVGINPVGGIGTETGATQTDDDLKLVPGMVADLAPGEEIQSTTPGRPNAAFDPFFQAIVRQIGVALEIPFEILIKHFQASYSASRAAMVEAWKFFEGRRTWLVQSFCQPIYEAWMEEAVATGRVTAPGFFDDPAIRKAYCSTRWAGDAMPQIDPVKEVEAARLRVELGISDRSTETAGLQGGDWETTHRQQVREAKMRKEGGLDQFVPAEPSIKAVDTSDGGDNPPATPQQPGGQQ